MRSVHRIHVASGGHDDETMLTINGSTVVVSLRALGEARIYAIDVVYDSDPPRRAREGTA